MELTQIALFLVLLLLVLLGSGVWIALALLGVGWAGLQFFTNTPPGASVASSLWGSVSSWSLAALPMFIWMGEILYRTRLAADLFEGLSPWLRWIPGRLLHINVLASGIFAAVIGSSAATTATVGKIALPELLRRGYPERLVLGSLAGSGTLGLLIPPSVMMIVYGVAAEVSVARLFIAGLLPGLLVMLLFMGWVMLAGLLNAKEMPPPDPPLPLGARLHGLLKILPVLLLMVAVIGSIYTGVATPTEAASLGVLGALIIALWTRSLSWQGLLESLMGAVRTSSMIGFILAGAAVLSIAMGFTGIPAALAAWVAGLGLSKYALLAVLMLLFLVLGAFLDGISIIVLTTSVILPLAKAVGIDLLWFGIFLVIAVELAQITPPVGFNLFVLQGLSGRDIFTIARSALPFLAMLLLAAALITVFPQIVTWLPARMTGG
ncbi:TRAP transporter large permease [Meiothermus taiwanensis]|uniref:TRAP dicarboxylate transporter, DctM subunit n=1 Tax=Meiothermus taiwanensis WR-220 TaxID=1339250 RepID=A0ABM6WGJ5_9DEIN|nr:TRAP transporter large permease subunit [Meiothermus taiwanensis]AWR86156.1 TRAP dicarboxylate transporter, DctM subunit [Meiothermus taiwanensis WR-220]KIQ54308.1 C4-dicarboxylate ABC transporter permease [Meiothermus taiwanensis]KZK16780.1 C4-dicarboxylate ABC transporter permease [Meiothermus taiwanensis]